MSTFEVKTRTIDILETHPNADKLELVIIGGYKAVVQKGIHKVGDIILYIPEDTVFTDLTIAEQMKVAAYLTGKQKNRVKAIRLRGILSQGIVLPFEVLDEVTSALGFGYYEHKAGIDLQEELKLEKYEEPIPVEMAGQVRSWPSFLPKYDVENIKRPESFAAMVPGEEVVATEKLHGTNITIAIGPGLEEGEKVFVCSRNNALKESDTNVYWRAVNLYGLDDDAVEMLAYFNAQTVSIHGEVIGVQDLRYGYSGGNVGFRAFDIMVNGEFIDYPRFIEACQHFGIPVVPPLFRGPYNYDHLAQLAEGRTNCTGDMDCEGDHIREGIVVKPVKERYDYAAGRCNFKFISEAYLLRGGKTSELH